MISICRSAIYSIITALLLSVFIFVPEVTNAQNAGVRISPATIEETVEPGITKTYDIEIENLNNFEQEFFLFTRNIRAVGEGGLPIFANSRWEQTGYELADWITLPATNITIPANGREVIQVNMAVPIDAACSHFGGVFVSAEPPDIENSGAAVGYQVANIMSIRVNGDCIEEASIRQFSTGKFLYGSQDVDFEVRIENTGTVLVRPSGPLEIFNALGKKVGDITFNEPPAGVFPGDTRVFTDVRWLGDGVGFGRYEAVLSPVYGEDGSRKTMSSTVTFWILPLGIIGPAFGVLAFILLVTIVAVRMYIKRALAQMNAGRRMVRRRTKAGPSMSLLLTVSVLIVLALFLLVMLVLFA